MPLAAHTSHRWLALAGIAIASFLGCLDFTIVNTTIPALQAHFDAGVEQVQWTVSVFVMALSTFMVAAGRLADLHGRRRALYSAMLVFAVASLGAGLAGQLGVLVGWRFAQGLACAVLYTSSATLVAQAFPEQQRGKALGLLFAANGLGLAAGPVLGGLLVAVWGWRSVFLLNVPLTALAWWLCRGHVQESRSDEVAQALDVPGLTVWMLALPCLLLAISQGGQWGWTRWPTLALLAVAAGLLVVFIVIEQRARHPLLDLGLLGNPHFVAAAVANALLAFFYCGAFLLMPLYLSQVRQLDSAHTGWLLLPVTVVMASVSPLAGRLADRVGSQWVMLAGFAALALSAGLQAMFTAHTGWGLVVLAFACMGSGWGCILGPATLAALGSVPQARGGLAMGACWTLHNLGGALGLAVITAVHQQAGGAFIDGLRVDMGVLVTICLLAIICLPLLHRAGSKRYPATYRSRT
ncbi:MFS transporter [Pseudomonas putida]